MQQLYFILIYLSTTSEIEDLLKTFFENNPNLPIGEYQKLEILICKLKSNGITTQRDIENSQLSITAINGLMSSHGINIDPKSETSKFLGSGVIKIHSLIIYFHCY